MSTNDGFLDNANEEKNVEGSLGSLAETEKENKKDRVFIQGKVDLVSVSSSRTEKEDFLVGNDDVNVGEKNKGLRLGQNNFEREIRYVDNCRQFSKCPIDVRVGGDDCDMNLNRSKSVISNVVEGIGEASTQLRNSSQVMPSRVILDNQVAEREGFREFDEELGADAGHSRLSPFPHSDEGSSNNKPNSLYKYGKPRKNFCYRDEPCGDESLELNRSEFNRKLHDLKEQISRLEGKPRERNLDDEKMAPSESYRDPAAYNVSMQPFLGYNHVVRPPNFNSSLGPAPSMNDHTFDMHNFYPSSRHVPHMMPRSNYEDPLRSQMLRRPHNQPPPPPPHQYPQQPPLDYYSGQYMDFNQDVLPCYPREPFLHQLACSCLHCCNRNWPVPPEVPSSGYSSRRLAKDPMRSNFYRQANPVEFGPQNYVPVRAIPPLHSQDPQLRTRWPTDIDSDVEAFYQSRPRRVVVAQENKRLCYPIAGGAPFMLCCNCLELLKLPRKVMAGSNNLQKLRCGTCSTSYSFEIKNKRLMISVPTETEKLSFDADDVPCGPPNGGILRTHGCSTAGGMNSCSIDFDSGYVFHSADTRNNLLLEDQMSNLSKSDKRQGQTSSSISAEEDKIPDRVIDQKDVSNSVELPTKDDMSPAVAASPVGNRFDDSASVHAVSSGGIGSRSKRTDHEKVIFTKIASQQNAEKDTSMEPEVEVSFNEYLNTSLSHDPVEVSKENQRRINKGHNTFLVGLIKKSFRDFSRSSQSTGNGRPNVSVNGQLIPDRLLKKAEKHAGPIEPGDYW